MSDKFYAILDVTDPGLTVIYGRATGDWLLPRLAITNDELAMLKVVTPTPDMIKDKE